jgi:hypothetical protein
MTVPSPAELAERLRAAPGSKERFGTTTAAVLETARLVAAADDSWDKGTVSAFQEQEKINVKVWGKLVAIARSDALQSLPPNDLPASYTALYALVVMTPQELQQAVAENVVRAKVSSRFILDWTKAFRLRGSGIEQEVPLTLVLRRDLTPQEHQDLQRALVDAAAAFDAEVIEGKGGIKQAGIKADLRRAKALEAEAELVTVLEPVVSNAPEDLKSKFEVFSAQDLATAKREVFTGFLQVLEGKASEMFWRKHGRAYALKIARDFNLVENRTERYLLKRRLESAQENWMPVIDGFQKMVDKVERTYMSK